MDWYFDITILLATFCVIAIGMTIYARLNPTRPRVRRLKNYIYTGIIPTITISSADSPTKRSPTTLTPADSIEEDEHKSNKTEAPVDDVELACQLKDPQNNRLSIPVLDDDDDDEEVEQQQSVQFEDISEPVSLPLVDNTEENKDKSQAVSLTSSPVENVKNDKDNSQTLSLISTSVENVVEQDKDNAQVISLAELLVEGVKDNERQPKRSLLFDKSDDEDHSETASVSLIDSAEDEYSQSMDSSELPDDLNASPILNKNGNSSEIYIDETPPSTSFTNSFTANKSLCKIGISHTVEDPLFPFSEILEEENPSVQKRFKKRLSQ